MRHFGVKNAKELCLRLCNAKDELELVARDAGFSSAMEMVLSGMGFTDIKNVPVIVEGSIMAGQYTLSANMKSGVRVNKLTPIPFHYVAPRTVVDSVTADADTSIAPQFK